MPYRNSSGLRTTFGGPQEIFVAAGYPAATKKRAAAGGEDSGT